MKIELEACEFVELIAKRAREAWGYEMEKKEAEALEDLFGCLDEVGHGVDYWADNYVVNGDRGKGGDSLFDSFDKKLEEIPAFLDDCVIVWGRSDIDKILVGDGSDEEKEKSIRSLGDSDFGFVVSF